MRFQSAVYGLKYDIKPHNSDKPYFTQRGPFTLVGPAWITGQTLQDDQDIGARVDERFLPSLWMSVSMKSEKTENEASHKIYRVAITKEEVSALESATKYIANCIY